MEFGLYFDVGDELDVVVAVWCEVNVLHDLRCFCPHIGAACTVCPRCKTGDGQKRHRENSHKDCVKYLMVELRIKLLVT